MKRNLLLLIVSLLWSSTIWAADGDVFTAKTVEGVNMTFKVLSETDKTCQVGDWWNCVHLYATEITIPEQVNGYRVVAINEYAFYGCASLTTITIPSSVSSIDNYVFSCCSNLNSITVNSENPVFDSRNNCNAIIKTADNKLLYGCMNTVIPNEVVSIGKFAFYQSGLKAIEIPSNVTTIGECAFAGCEMLSEIAVESGNPVYDSRDNCNAIIKTSSNMLIVGCMNTIIPDGVTAIGEDAFSGCINLTSIAIPNSVTNIGGYAFSQCSGLKDMVIPESVTSIGNYAFSTCTGLTSMVIPNNVTYLGWCAFYDCHGLTELTLGSGLTYISESAFTRCTRLTSVIVKKANPLTINRNTFADEAYQNATLFVPKGRDTYYRGAEGWKEFSKIEGIEMAEVPTSTSKFENLEDNQMILGYYTTNDSIATTGSGYGGAYAGTYKVCIGFSKENITPFAGNRITDVRFALLNTDMTDARIWIGSSRDKEDLYTQSLTTLKAGWNEVRLDTPFEITEDSIYIGLMYQQIGRNYPISLVSKGAEKGSCYFYGPYNNGNYMWLEDEMSLSFQCLVEGDQLPLYDIHTIRLSLDGKYYKSGNETRSYLYLRNWGRNTISNYEISCQIDGTEIETFSGTYLAGSIINSNIVSMSYPIRIPEDLPVGAHKFTFSVKSINGEAPAYADDDSQSVSLLVYVSDMGRQKLLLDLFTGTWCPYCPRADRWVEGLKKERDDIALVSSHYSDRFSCEASEAYCVFTPYFPNYFFDRYASTGASELTYLYPDNAKIQPSFANVNIESTYDESTKTATIKVYGQKSEEFDLLIGNANLTVLLTEDQIVAGQADAENGYQENFVHQGVLRTNVSAIWGDPVAWNGDRYEKTYIVKLDDSWVKDNMNVVAFLGKPFTGDNYDELHVVNCNDFALKDATPTHGGDANVDGTVNAADIVEVVNYIMGNPSAIFDESSADLNGDGVVNAADIVEMVNIIMAAK